MIPFAVAVADAFPSDPVGLQQTSRATQRWTEDSLSSWRLALLAAIAAGPPFRCDDEDGGVGRFCPRVFVVGTDMRAHKPRPFLFRNYNLPQPSRYVGSTAVPVWSSLRATTAAPAYFTEHRIDGVGIFQDGALTANNPTGVAIHESKMLFPRREIDCVVSIGTGKFRTDSADSKSNLGIIGSMRSAMRMVVDTEVVHDMLRDFLSTGEPDGSSRRPQGRRRGVYVRLNPDIEPVALDERRTSVLSKLQSSFDEWVKGDNPGQGRGRIRVLRAILDQPKTRSFRGIARDGLGLYLSSRL